MGEVEAETPNCSIAANVSPQKTPKFKKDYKGFQLYEALKKVPPSDFDFNEGGECLKVSQSS